MKTLELTDEEVDVLKTVMMQMEDTVHHVPEAIDGGAEEEELDQILKTFAALSSKVDAL